MESKIDCLEGAVGKLTRKIWMSSERFKKTERIPGCFGIPPCIPMSSGQNSMRILQDITNTEEVDPFTV